MGHAPRRVLAAILALAVCAPAVADFKRDYGNAMKAIQSSNWADAAQDLREAIADNPDSAERVRLYGMRFDAYLPHYFLGEALFQMGDCAGAVQAWTEAERRGVIQTQPQYAQMQANLKSCSGSAIDVSAIATTAGQAIDALKAASDRLAALRRDPMMGSSWSQFESQAGQAAQQVGALRQRLDQAVSGSDADAIESVEREAGRATTSVNGLIAQAESLIEENRVAANQSRQELLRAMASARVADDKGSSDPKVRQVKGELLALVNQADQLGANANPDQYRDLTRAIRNKEREFDVALQDWESAQRAAARRTPPDALKRVAEAYFAGNYQDAARLADPDAFQDAREQIQAHLFRAAARFNIYALNGADDRRLLQQVQNDIRSIKRLDRAFSPYLAAFPPKFMTLFENT